MDQPVLKTAVKTRRSSLLRRFAKDQSGAYVVITAIGLPALIGAFGFMSEVAYWYSQKQHEQFASDAAAISAARALSSGEKAHLHQLARSVTAANGYVHQEKNVQVQVNNPPLSGPSMGSNGAIEVIITATHEPLFSAIFGLQNISIKSRSVATIPGNGCVLALNQTDNRALYFQGSSTVTLTNCSLHGNSASSSGLEVSGSSKVVTDAVYLHGGGSYYPAPAPGSTGLYAPTGVFQYGGMNGDPYAGTAMPPRPTTGCTAQDLTISGNRTLTPGVYCGGITLRSNATVTLTPGTYFIAGGDLSINSANASLSGSGVTLVFTNDPRYPWSWGGAKLTGGYVNLTAPKNNDALGVPGVLMFQDRSSPTYIGFDLTGGSTMNLGGAIYLSKADVKYTGGATSNGCTQLIADTITFIGNADLQLNCSGYPTKGIGGHLALTE